MIDWIKTNKEWLFSGVGLTALASIGGIIATLYSKKEKPISLLKKPESPKKKADFQILFIDDETSFKVVKILKAAGWTSTTIVRDVSTVDSGEVGNADLIFVDVQGVGREMGFKEGGLGLTQAIKKRHPSKFVVIYSAETRGNRFHDALKIADNFLPKTSDPYQFQQIVERFFEEWSNR